ncbi:MAG: high-potential iron-sulfur protein [Leptospiraceae bacterium]|nr:high-potential iron-sulfur protein [Leptospiraceae bacterium]MDW7975297.1 high-potential iron-sulfur protein [Leptospiraceae bacterium]
MEITRKEFLKQVGIVGSTILFGPMIISNCKPEEKQAQKGPICDDVTGLTQEEIEQRKNLQYTDFTPDPSKLCENCALYVLPEGNSPCGKCNLIKGPVSPKGWCTSWVPKA